MNASKNDCDKTTNDLISFDFVSSSVNRNFTEIDCLFDPLCPYYQKSENVDEVSDVCLLYKKEVNNEFRKSSECKINFFEDLFLNDHNNDEHSIKKVEKCNNINLNKIKNNEATVSYYFIKLIFKSFNIVY